MKSTEKRGKDDLYSSSIAVAVALMLAFLLSIPMLKSDYNHFYFFYVLSEYPLSNGINCQTYLSSVHKIFFTRSAYNLSMFIFIGSPAAIAPQFKIIDGWTPFFHYS